MDQAPLSHRSQSIQKYNLLYDVNFDRKSSCFNSLLEDGKSQYFQVNINMSSMKLFSLIMCKGNIFKKLIIFLDIIYGKDENEEVSYDQAVPQNPYRVKMILKKLIYFCIIMPKKYHEQFLT